MKKVLLPVLFWISLCGSEQFFLSASYLYWQSKVWGLDFAEKAFPDNFKKWFIPDFAWSPGAKVYLGTALPRDGWDLRVGWTIHWNEFTHHKRSFESQIVPEGLGIIPLWHFPFVQIPESTPLRYRFASGKWKLDFNSVDLELGSTFCFEPSIRLNLGAKGALVQQKYRVQYDQGNSLFVSSRFTSFSHQWGLGPRFGIESKWHLFHQLNLIANGAFSILCSFFDLDSSYHDVLSSRVFDQKIEEDFHELTPICEAMIGLDWGTTRFRISAGYEYQYWWTVNHMRRNYVQTLPGETFDMQGELQMQGLNGAVQFDF